ncbi:MAG TPA: hypothetical protein VHG08_11710 [Longimicrobium sp.]|nr:hypothetical protein [Longimicrobium sp.]
MKRTRLNMLLVAVVVAGAPIALAPSPAMAGGDEGSGGTCCEAESGSCYLNLDGVIIRESPAYHQKSGSACSAN